MMYLKEHKRPAVVLVLTPALDHSEPEDKCPDLLEALLLIKSNQQWICEHNLLGIRRSL